MLPKKCVRSAEPALLTHGQTRVKLETTHS